MSLIIVENIDFSYAAELLLAGASFRVSLGERVGLLGPNGCGKSTLLRLLLGELSPLSGQIHRRNELAIGYLPQDPPAPTQQTLREAAIEVFSEQLAREAKLTELAEALAETTGEKHDKVLGEYERVQAAFDADGGYDFHQRIDEVLTGLNFSPVQQAQPLAELSGGQRTRAHLACLLLKRPDLLLLDEPTNHLDLEAVEWLENFLAKRWRGGLIVVSHDRWFLDAVTTTTWEICGKDLEVYNAAYTKFVPLREQRRLERQRLYDAQQDYIRQTRDFIARFISGQRTKEAQGRRTRLERFMRDEAISAPPETRNIHLQLTAAKRPGQQMLRGELTAGYDEPLVHAEGIEIHPGQRIAMIGANGCGKTTLLRTMLGELPALGGEIVPGANVETGYLSQSHAELDPDQSVLDSACNGKTDAVQQVRDILGALRLTGDMTSKPVGELSGGQRSRVILARLAMQNANLLYLDEPTNHLDMDSVEILQESLESFAGAVLFVSHDRRFIQALATDIWLMEDGKITKILGNWDDYLAWRTRRKSSAKAAQAEQAAGGSGKSASEPSPEEAGRDQKKADYKAVKKQANRLQKLKRDHEKLEAGIFTQESLLEEIKEKISAASEQGDMSTVETLAHDYQAADEKLKTQWATWETMGEELEEADA